MSSERAIIVPTLGRAGSSCLCGALHRMGVPMWLEEREREDQGSFHRNPGGVYECGKGTFAEDQITKSRNYRYVRSYIMERSELQPLWGWKPGLFHYWSHRPDVVEKLPDPVFLFATRNIEDQLESWVRCGAEREMYEKTLKLFTPHIIEWLQESGFPFAVIEFEKMIENPEKVLTSVANLCGLDQSLIPQAVKWVNPEWVTVGSGSTE